MVKPSLVLIAVGVLLGASGVSDAAAGDGDNLQGVWRATEVTEAGKKVPEAVVKERRIEFKADKITITAEQGGVTGKYKIDPKKSPAIMDIILEKEGKTFTFPYIYELKGDELTLCHPAVLKGTRPKQFEATKNTVLAKFKRQKP